MTLQDYVLAHTVRGECQCGKCADKGDAPDPVGHTADMVFFKVATTGGPTAEEFRRLTDAHHGVFVPCDPFDGGEHSYIELGGWIGDQGVALQYMALGVLLGVFRSLTPRTMFGGRMPDDMVLRMAEGGFLSVQAQPEQAVTA